MVVSVDMRFMQTFVSVDCVIFGFDGNDLNVLLVRRQSELRKDHGLKLPGSLIFQEEDADIAAYRVLYELTDIRKMALKQFKSFTSPKRTANPSDVRWLEYAYKNKIDRLITIAYLSLCRIDRQFNAVSKYKTVEWRPVGKLPEMPFDHNQIVASSIKEIQHWIDADRTVIAELLPPKFTASALQNLYEAIYQKRYDVRNFRKKMNSMEYIVPLNETQEDVPHRAAKLYKFDKPIYRKRIITV
jgi:hypothetical protein